MKIRNYLIGSVVALLALTAYALTTSGTTAISGVRRSTWAYNTTGAVSLTVGTGQAIRIHEIRLGLSAAGGAGNLTAVIQDGDYATIDLNVLTQDMTSASDVQEIYEGDFDLAAGDTLVLAYANANNKTYLIKVIYEVL